MTYLMEIDNLGKRYDDFELSGVSLAVEPGCVVGFIGSNGAGNTTTINAALGIIAADERAVTILSINEGLQHHFHAKERGELLLTDSGYTAHNHSPEDIGHMSALSVIPALIPASIDFDEKAHEGRRLYAQIVKASY